MAKEKEALGAVRYATDRMAEQIDRIWALEAENRRLKAVLEDGCDLGLAPDECREALSKCEPPVSL